MQTHETTEPGAGSPAAKPFAIVSSAQGSLLHVRPRLLLIC